MRDQGTAPTVRSDSLVRDLLGLDAGSLAAAASMDAEARLRLGPDEPTELDGLEVVVRRAVADSLVVRARRHTVVRLLSSAAARADGWPDARVGNLSRLLAWARSVDDRQPGAARPRLVGADATSACDEVRVSELARDWLGLGPRAHVKILRAGDDPAELRMPESAAQAQLAWILSDALRTYEVMRREGIEAVRLKTEGDARLARHPGARASNVALILAVGLCHARSGYSVVVLPAREGFAEELAEAGRAFGREHGGKDLIDDEVVADRLLLADACARDYVHVGRAGAREVAARLVRRAWERASTSRPPRSGLDRRGGGRPADWRSPADDGRPEPRCVGR